MRNCCACYKRAKNKKRCACCKKFACDKCQFTIGYGGEYKVFCKSCNLKILSSFLRQKEKTGSAFQGVLLTEEPKN